MIAKRGAPLMMPVACRKLAGDLLSNTTHNKTLTVGVLLALEGTTNIPEPATRTRIAICGAFEGAQDPLFFMNQSCRPGFCL
jgi:hypothetical protein